MTARNSLGALKGLLIYCLEPLALLLKYCPRRRSIFPAWVQWIFPLLSQFYIWNWSLFIYLVNIFRFQCPFHGHRSQNVSHFLLFPSSNWPHPGISVRMEFLLLWLWLIVGIRQSALKTTFCHGTTNHWMR